MTLDELRRLHADFEAALKNARHTQSAADMRALQDAIGRLTDAAVAALPALIECARQLQAIVDDGYEEDFPEAVAALAALKEAGK